MLLTAFASTLVVWTSVATLLVPAIAVVTPLVEDATVVYVVLVFSIISPVSSS